MSDFEHAIFGPHSLEQLAKRGITEEVVRTALASGPRVDAVRPGRVVAQALIAPEANGRLYVIRIFMDVDRSPPVIVTVYRSSKLTKYWRVM